MKVYLLAGSPGVGKSTLMKKLQHKFEVMDQDHYIGKPYLQEVVKRSRAGRKILANTPFSVSEPLSHLQSAGIQVVVVFIVEHNDVVASRYQQREGKPIPAGHLTRQDTYRKRAKELNAFIGTVEEAFKYLSDQ